MPSLTTMPPGAWHRHTRWIHPLVRMVWLASILLVSYTSLLPRMDLPCSFGGADKIAHFLAYFWLTGLPFFGFDRARTAAAAGLSMIALGLGLELGQAFIPGRTFSPMDILANSAGVGMGLLLFRNVHSTSVSG